MLANDLVTFKRLVKIIMKIGRDNYAFGLSQNLVNNAIFKEMVGNGPKNKTDEDAELKPDFCFSFVLMHAIVNDDPDVVKFLKSVFSRLTSRQDTKDWILRFSTSYDSNSCNSTTRTLHKLISYRNGEIVPLTSHDFFIQFQSRSLAAISTGH